MVGLPGDNIVCDCVYEVQDHWVSLRTRFRHRQLYSRRPKNQAERLEIATTNGVGGLGPPEDLNAEITILEDSRWSPTVILWLMCRADSDASDMSHFDFEDGEDDNISVAWFGDEGEEVTHEHDSDHDLNHEFNDHSRGDFVDEEKWEIARLKALSGIHPVP